VAFFEGREEGTRMQPKPLPDFDDPMQALEAGIAEANRRECGDFDGLLGWLDPEGEESILLRDILSRLKGYLLDRYSDEEARHLLDESEPPIIKGGATAGVVHWNAPVVDDDVRLAIDLLRMIRSAAHCEGERLAILILGKAGARDRKAQAGRRKAGDATGNLRKEAAALQHAKWIERARQMISAGKYPHEVSGIIASNDPNRAKQVRTVLQRAGIVPRRNKRK
jgi:hypothetical protein